MSIDFRDHRATDLAADVRAARRSARELTGAALERIDRLDPDLGAFVTVDAERALAEAAALDERVAAGEDPGPLAGLPIGVKDLEDAEGIVTTHGSALHAEDPPARHDSVLVSRLRAAGCIVVGKTNTPEVGHAGETINPVAGSTRNPWDTARSPGGSSGGTAAALAAGMIPLATGSDGGGSIRIPSAICGLPGLKPSNGRIPCADAEPPSALVLSTRGPMTTRVDDLAAVLALVVGPHPADPFCLPPPHDPWHGVVEGAELPARVLWAPDGGGFPVDAEVRRVTSAAVEQLAGAGVEVIEVGDDLFPTDPMVPWFVLWSQAMARTYLHVEGTPDWDRVSGSLRDQIEMGRGFGPLDVIRSFDEIHRINHRVTDHLHRAPLLLLPTVNGRAPLSGEDGTVDGEPTPLWCRLTQAFNLTRHPAGSLPVGLDERGMPVGLQVVGPQHADVAVLRAMAAIGEVVGFEERPPDPAT